MTDDLCHLIHFKALGPDCIAWPPGPVEPKRGLCAAGSVVAAVAKLNGWEVGKILFCPSDDRDSWGWELVSSVTGDAVAQITYEVYLTEPPMAIQISLYPPDSPWWDRLRMRLRGDSLKESCPILLAARRAKIKGSGAARAFRALPSPVLPRQA